MLVVTDQGIEINGRPVVATGAALELALREESAFWSSLGAKPTARAAYVYASSTQSLRSLSPTLLALRRVLGSETAFAGVFGPAGLPVTTRTRGSLVRDAPCCSVEIQLVSDGATSLGSAATWGELIENATGPAPRAN